MEKLANAQAEDQSVSPLSIPTISLPKGGGAITGLGEKFSTNGMTGTGSLTIPISVSPGRSGFAPQVSLTYDSGGPNTVFGVGWTISLVEIVRKTEKGLPRYRDRDESEESDVFILSGYEDLVPCLRRTSESDWIRDEEERDGFQIRYYRPRIEGIFARIERWTRLSDGDIHWRSFTRDNVLTIYGDTPESRISDPEHPLHIFKWLISSSYDCKGNAIAYEYIADDLRGVDQAKPSERRHGPMANRYVKQILYGNRRPVRHKRELANEIDWMFEVVFDFGDEPDELPTGNDCIRLETGSAGHGWPVRLDPFSTWRSGFEVRTYRLCRRVLMFHRFPEELGRLRTLVHSTALRYDERAIGSFLVAAVQSGYTPLPRDGLYIKKSLPPLELGYTPSPLEAEEPGPFELKDAEPENLPEGIDGDRYRWIDLDGEGIPGVLTEQGAGWYFKRNLGHGRFSATKLIARKPSTVRLSDSRQQLLDVDGDGQLDLVDFTPGAAGFYGRTSDPAEPQGLDAGWGRFRPFRAFPTVDFSDPNLRLVDVTGDGIADILITEDVAFRCYPSLGYEGFGPAIRIPAPGEDDGPRIVFADATNSIHLADMTGDGLSDIVRIRNGEVCYWPNRGYGRFGQKIVMDRSPWFDKPGLFDSRRIRLADTDGSGPTDILYICADTVQIYLNEAGNALSPAKLLRGLPNTAGGSVSVVDFLGRGTACLVWSSPLRPAEQRPLRYVDLMRGTKPHLLTRVVNNLGAATLIEYASSTEFYLADRAAGRPWVTPLAFPVYVVKRVETFDTVGRHRFVSTMSYHHGYYDAVEREFRGFGRIDQLDAEQFDDAAERLFPAGDNEDAAWRLPPVLTKTWYHTGVFFGIGRISRHLAHEYYRAPGEMDEMRLDDTVLPREIGPEEAREGCRGLKGTRLRQEVYALDGSEEADRPYSVTESNATMRLLQPRGCNLHCVVFVHAREDLSASYERKLYQAGETLQADPRVTHGVTLVVDAYGNIVKSVSIAYGRRLPDRSGLLTDNDRARQAALLATVSENRYTNAVDQADNYRAPVLAEARLYELVQLPDKKRLFRFNEIRQLVTWAGDGLRDLPYEDVDAQGAVDPGPYRRLIGDQRNFYRSDDLAHLLPLGGLEALALPGESFSLSLTPGLIAKVYGGKLADPEPVLRHEGGYADLDGDGAAWVPSGRMFYSPDALDDAAAELAVARRHFFLPRRFCDPFGNVSFVDYDRHDLIAVETRDPVGNTVRSRIDYRVLQPNRLTDPNGNRSDVAFDALARVAGTAVMGKQGENVGDSLEGFVADLPEHVVLAHLRDPLRNPWAVLGNATTRILYDVFAFDRTRHEPRPQPAVTYSLSRETHVSDLAPGERTKIQHAFAYSDGLGREVQRKRQAEPGPVPGHGDADPRWVGSGWTIFNNKGDPVRQFEPFFSTHHRFEFAVTQGVATMLIYDAMERVVAMLNPNHSFQKTVFDPWQQKIWDTNDTVLLDPAKDPDVGPLIRRLPSETYLPTWYEERDSGDLGPAEQEAAHKAAAHANTPATIFADPLGQTFLSVAHNKFPRNGTPVDVYYGTRSELDIQGNLLSVTDALGRVVTACDYDIGQRTIRQNNSDSGARWLVLELAGKPIIAFDSRHHSLRYGYDRLRRPTMLFVRMGDGPERLVEQVEYGEDRPDALATNLRGQIYRKFDGAGIATTSSYDFKGNLLSGTREILADVRNEVDWSTTPALLDEIFSSETSYDALNRPVTLTAPDASIIRPTYNVADLLERLDVNLKGAPSSRTLVKKIEYSASGQRLLIEYGNGTHTANRYDPLTFRLVRLNTTRCSDDVRLRDLIYVYDPVGNISSARDAARQTVYFKNQAVRAHGDYVFDALYRLIRSEGREHAGAFGKPQTTNNDAPRIHLPLPGDGRAMRTYREHYQLDAVGNILDLIHEAGADGSWQRHYHYGEIASSNRLTGTRVGRFDGRYEYDQHGNMTRMPHLPVMRWDFRDQLAETQAQIVEEGQPARTTHYLYDGNGQRARKVIVDHNGKRRADRIYIGAFEVYREFDSGGDAVELERTTLHVMDDGGRVALVETRENETSIRYQYADNLGSACVELDDKGAVITYEEYYPYGSTSYQSGRTLAEVSLKRYRFTGKERDNETGFHYQGARYYASWLGRWTSCDPAGFVDGPNLFVYAASNPVGAIDPTGTQAVNPTGEKKYDEGTDDATGAHETYTVTPDLESHEYVEFPDDTITATPKKPPPNSDKKDGSGFTIIAEPFDVEAFLDSVNKALQQTETDEYKTARAIAGAERARQLEFEQELAEEAQIDKELPGLGGSLIPIYGNGMSSYVHFKHGNYGRGVIYAVLAVSDVFLVKSLVVGAGKAAIKVGAGGLGALGGTLSKSGAAGVGKEGLILFGQKRVAPTFRTYSEASDLIRGKTLVEVAEGLKAGHISPSDLPVEYFIQNGQRIAVNNRGLAALRMAGLEPTVVREVPKTTDLLARLAEAPIDRFHKIPGLRMAVTLEKSGGGHLYTVFVP